MFVVGFITGFLADTALDLLMVVVGAKYYDYVLRLCGRR